MIATKIIADINTLDDEGTGVGVTNTGATVSVPRTLPGERVRAEVVARAKSGLIHARLLTVELPAPERVPVECKQYWRCGGCDLLHASLELQHSWKRQRVATALNVPLDFVAHVLASPRAQGYRAFAKLVVGPDRILGSYRPRSHQVQDMRGCKVHAPEIEAILNSLRAWVQEPLELDLRYVLVRASLSEAKAIVTLVSRTEAAPGVDFLVERLSRRPDVARVLLHVNASDGNALLSDQPERVVHDAGPVVEKLGEIEQDLTLGAFAQINPGAAAGLYHWVVQSLELQGPVLDLYAGSGGIALSLLAAGAPQVIAVESELVGSQAAVAAAQRGGWGERFEAHTGQVAQLLSQLPVAPEVVVNPPRKGLGSEVVAALAQRPWRRLIYVSCNPETLAQDLAELGKLTSISVAEIQPVDLFPHTRHVETGVRIERLSP